MCIFCLFELRNSLQEQQPQQQCLVKSLKNTLHHQHHKQQQHQKQQKLHISTNHVYQMDSNSNIINSPSQIEDNNNNNNNNNISSADEDDHKLAERQLSVCSLSSVDFTSDYSDNDVDEPVEEIPNNKTLVNKFKNIQGINQLKQTTRTYIYSYI